MSNDGYASPDGGRKRHKAGAQGYRGMYLPMPTWQIAGLGAIGVVVAICSIFGLVAGAIYLSSRDTAGSQWTKVMTSCVPLNHTFSYSAEHDLTDFIETATLEIARTHNVVTATTVFALVGGTANDLVIDLNEYALFLDSRCIPPSASFAPCSDPCPAPDDLMDESTLVGNSAAQLPVFGIVHTQVAGTINVNAPGTGFVYPIQAESGGINWYGVDFTNPVEFDVAGGYALAQVVFTLTYTTNASSSWTIPDFCASGPCQSQD